MNNPYSQLNDQSKHAIELERIIHSLDDAILLSDDGIVEIQMSEDMARDILIALSEIHSLITANSGKN